MKIFGVNIIYDQRETLLAIKNYKQQLPEKQLRKLRAYELTDEFDKFQKYRYAFGFWDIFKIHLQKVWDYWFIRRPKYRNQ